MDGPGKNPQMDKLPREVLLLRMPLRKALGLLTVASALTLILLLIFAACGSEDGADPSGSASEGDTTPKGAGEEPEPTRLGIPSRSDSGPTSEPEASSTPKGHPCPVRQADMTALLSPEQTSAETDKEALLALFEATRGDTWDSSGTWAGLAPIGEWQGVMVDDAGRVVGLNLFGLTGELPPELGNLSSLQSLSLSGIQLAGELPPELGSLVALQALAINESQVSGGLPPELGDLTSLETLDLGNNRLCGEIPSELDGLAELGALNLGSNQLTGRIPEALARLTKLETLDLGSNQFTGAVPSWLGGLSGLTALDVSNNRLTGELPPELDNLAVGLNVLNVGGNQLDGCKSDLLRDLVDQSNDSLPVCASENHAGDTETLVALYRAWGEPNLRNWLSREPISEWSGVSVGLDGRVASLQVNVSGELPPELGNLRGLQVLDVRQSLTGELPPELSNLTNLKILHLEGYFTGELPPGIVDMADLRAIYIGHKGSRFPDSRFVLGGCSSGENLYVGTLLERLCDALRSGFASVSVGRDHTCVVRTSGSIQCWGRTGYGGKTIPPPGEFASVSAGSIHTCGVKVDGTVACWGDDRSPPVAPLPAPPQGEFASVSAGYGHTCGVRTDGTVECWGPDDHGQATPPQGEFASVSAGGRLHLRGEDGRHHRVLGK